MHLQVAERICQRPDLPAELRVLLTQEWSAFYLGSVAPDFQTIAATKREVTHFYPIPPAVGDYAAFARMLAAHPELGNAAVLPAKQAVFIAAYGAHLLYDLLWNHRILAPKFMMGEGGDRYERFVAHNTLLTYLDRLAHAELPADAGVTLGRVAAHGWLPFDDEEKLTEWQTMLVAQLQPNAQIETVQIYAQRMRMSPEEFAAHLDDPEWMEQYIFQYVALPEVEETAATAVEWSVPLLMDYLKPRFR